MLRRYAPIAASRGTVIPQDVRARVEARDHGCVCERAGFPPEVVARCGGDLQPDHVRASHGMGMKSRSTDDNLVMLSAASHRWKTENGRIARPLLLAYLERVDDPHASHVDPCSPECHHGSRKG